MKSVRLEIPDVVMFEPNVFGDDRGYFFESFNLTSFSKAVGWDVNFVQDNESRSKKAVLRGLHYQVIRPQGKLVRVTEGAVFDVAVDIRRDSPSFGKWVGETLSAENKRQLWIPEGFAHGFLVLSEFAKFQYKVTDYWFPEYERCIRFDDPNINVRWPVLAHEFPIALSPELSEKDLKGAPLDAADLF